MLATRITHFTSLFNIGKGLHEGGSAQGQDIVLEEVSAGTFQVLLEFLYANRLPEEEGCGQGLEAGEMVKVADRFQATGLYEHCLEQFREWMEVGTAMERLVQAHVSGLEELQTAAMEYVLRNYSAIQTEAANTIDQVLEHPDLNLDLLKKVPARD